MYHLLAAWLLNGGYLEVQPRQNILGRADHISLEFADWNQQRDCCLSSVRRIMKTGRLLEQRDRAACLLFSMAKTREFPMDQMNIRGPGWCGSVN